MNDLVTYYCNSPNYLRKGRPEQWTEVNPGSDAMYGSYPTFSFIPGTHEDEEPIRYGDFVTDLDTKEIACNDALKIIGWFSGVYGVEAEQWKVFLSGKKGVHLELPAEIMGLTHGSTYLPLAYKRLAKDLEGELGITIDVSMYNMGTGKPYRRPNVMRDIGTCKRQIQVDTLHEIQDADDYMKACDFPGDLWEVENKSVNVGLATKMKSNSKPTRTVTVTQPPSSPGSMFPMSQVTEWASPS